LRSFIWGLKPFGCLCLGRCQGARIFGAEQSWEAAHSQQAASVTVRSLLVQTAWFVSIRVSPFCSAYACHDDIPYRRTKSKMAWRWI